MPMCPYCHVEIDEVDMTDFENHDCQVDLYYIGNCHKCHRIFKWCETYTWTEEFNEFEEITL